MDISCKLFNSLIEPVLLYASEIWGAQFISLKKLEMFLPEKVLLKFCKSTLQVNNHAHNWACRSELGLYPLLLSVLIKMVNFYSHMQNTNNVILQYAFTECKILAQKNSGWLYKLYTYIDNIHQDRTILNNPALLIKIIKTYYQFIFIENLSATIKPNGSSNKMRTYKLFKDNIQIEPYLLHCIHPQHRKHFSKLRLSNHSLKVETGRHTNPFTPLEKRLCNQCNVIEDEYHHIVECEKYTSQRSKLYQCIESNNSMFTNMSSQEQFIFIMQNQNPAYAGIVCKLIYNYTANQ